MHNRFIEIPGTLVLNTQHVVSVSVFDKTVTVRTILGEGDEKKLDCPSKELAQSLFTDISYALRHETKAEAKAV